MIKRSNKFISLLLSLSILISITLSSTFAFAKENVQIQIAKDNLEVVDTLEVEENKSIQLSALVTSGKLPDSYKLVWSTQTPYLANVNQNGVVTGIDSSKGAIIRIWIDTKVATIPVVGKSLAENIKAKLDKYDVDAMNTDDIVKTMRVIVCDVLKNDDALVNYLMNSLQKALDNINNTIKCSVIDENGKEITSDSVKVLVRNSSKFYSDFIPNGTYITNKSELPSKVAVGYQTQLTGITTPLRTHMGVNWSIKSDLLNRDVAQIDKEGNIKFLKPGKVTIIASPDANEFMNNLRKMMVEAEKLGEKVDGNFVATILVDVMGVDVDKEFLADVINKIAGTKLSDNEFINFVMDNTAKISNFILKMTTNDKITFNVVENITVEDFKIAGNTVIKDGESSQLTITNPLPKGSVARSVSWKTSNPSIANITQDGMLTGRDSGYAGKDFSVAATVNGVERSARGTVKGAVNKFSPTALEIINPKTDKFYVGDTIKLSYNIYPSTLYSSFKKASFGLIIDGKETFGGNLSDGIVSIDQNGVVTALSEGTTTILCRANKNNNVVDHIQLTVDYKNDKLQIKQGDYVRVDIPNHGLYAGKSVQLNATMNGKPVNKDDVKWSSDEWTIKVDDEGKVTCTTAFVKSTLITVKSKDGKYSASTRVNFVKEPVKSVSLVNKDLTLYAGNSQKLEYKLNPSDVTIEDVQWSSSNEKVATVDKNGKVTAINPGEATVTVKSLDGGFTATCNVKVPGSEIIKYQNNFAPDTVYQKVGLFKKYQNSSIQLSSAYNGENSPYTQVSWHSSSKDVKVNENGKCTPTSNKHCMSWISVTLKDTYGNEIRSTVKAEFYKTFKF